jgi:hypothetical protein
MHNKKAFDVVGLPHRAFEEDHEATPVHHGAWRRSGMAVSGAGAAATDDTGDRVS